MMHLSPHNGSYKEKFQAFCEGLEMSEVEILIENSPETLKEIGKTISRLMLAPGDYKTQRRLINMDTTIQTTQNGSDYNRFGEEIVTCELCGGSTTMLGTRLCDPCWELWAHIEFDLKLSERIIKQIKEKRNGRENK